MVMHSIDFRSDVHTMIDPGVGFRLLAVGEVRRQNDEVLHPHNGQWVTLFAPISETVRPESFPVRRAIRVCEDDRSKRYLDLGERPVAGDEYCAWSGERELGWNTIDFGSALLGGTGVRPSDAPRNGYGNEPFFRRMRRPIEPHTLSRCADCGGAGCVRCATPDQIANAPTQPAKPALVECGCKKHKIDPNGDLYAQHSAWSREHDEWMFELLEATSDAIGVGISAPPRLTVFSADATGDDIARDLTNDEMRAFEERRRG